MSISKDLFLAILSMDAYNRGYDAGISDGGAGDTDGLGVSVPGQDYYLGNAKIIDSKGDAEAQAAGFYAVAYELTGSYTNPDGTSLTAGDTVISYRGTDNPDFLGLGEGGSDVWNGWITGAGIQGSQSNLALAFHDAVEALPSAGGTVDVSTGDSLGGEVAGFVASSVVRYISMGGAHSVREAA